MMIENLPVLSQGFLDWIESKDWSDKVILELGAGASTVFFSKFFKTVYSIESNPSWYEDVLETLESKNIKNVKIRLVDASIIEDKEFLDLVKLADLFLIDNSTMLMERDIFAKFIHENRKSSSIIVLDNGDSNPIAYEMLRRLYYCNDYPRLLNGMFSVTTVFFKPRNIV